MANALHHTMTTIAALPVGYTPLEYVAAPIGGDAYVDTGIVLRDHTIRGRFAQPTYVDNIALFGAWSQGSPFVVFHCTFYSRRLYFGLSSANEHNVDMPGGFNANWHDYDMSYGEALKLDGDVLYTLSGETPIFANSSCYVFSRNIYDRPNVTTKYTRCSAFQIYDNEAGKVVCDLLPVMDNDGIACFYDMAAHAARYSIGTNQLVAGPEISV